MTATGPAATGLGLALDAPTVVPVHPSAATVPRSSYCLTQRDQLPPPLEEEREPARGRPPLLRSPPPLEEERKPRPRKPPPRPCPRRHPQPPPPPRQIQEASGAEDYGRGRRGPAEKDRKD